MTRRLLALAVLTLPATLHAETRRDMLTSFDKIRVEAPYDVHLVTGRGATGVVEADHRLIDGVSLTVQGTTLIVSTATVDRSATVPADAALPVITLTTPSLRGATVNSGGRLRVTGMKSQRLDLYVGGSGGITVTGVEADELNATLTGSGSVTLAGHAQRARLSVSGPGAIESTALSTNDLIVRLDGAGDVKASARSTANVTSLGTGSVAIAGTPSCTVNRQSGGPVVCGK